MLPKALLILQIYLYFGKSSIHGKCLFHIKCLSMFRKNVLNENKIWFRNLLNSYRVEPIYQCILERVLEVKFMKTKNTKKTSIDRCSRKDDEISITITNSEGKQTYFRNHQSEYTQIAKFLEIFYESLVLNLKFQWGKAEELVEDFDHLQPR